MDWMLTYSTDKISGEGWITKVGYNDWTFTKKQYDEYGNRIYDFEEHFCTNDAMSGWNRQNDLLVEVQNALIPDPTNEGLLAQEAMYQSRISSIEELQTDMGTP